jgi:aerotaxis receptor
MTISLSVPPTGLEHRIGPAELFFSTTDRRGVIRSGNSVFVRVSHYSLDELTGSPHSVVRHPDMPAGAYRLMWDRLLAGRPMGAYVKNLARDGSYYWVFATVTPLGEGFLSVRMAPRVTEVFDLVQELYAQVRTVEQEAADVRGLDRRAVAEVGAARIEEGLRGLGFAGYDDFLQAALPAEIAARGRLVSDSFARSWVRGPMAELLDGSVALEAELGELVHRLEAYQQLSEQLVRSSERMLSMAHRLDRAVDSARLASEAVADTAPVLLNVASVMAGPMRGAVESLEQLAARLDALRADVAALRFRIALAVLHNDMVAAFVAEVVDGAAPASSLAEVPLLCDAVHEGVLEMTTTAAGVDADLRDVATLVGVAGERLDEFRRFLGQWRILVMRHRAGGSLGALLGPIDDQIADGHDGIEMLRALAGQCRAAVLGLDADALETLLARIRRGAAGV